MGERFNLGEMLREIEREEAAEGAHGQSNRKLSKGDIKKLFAAKRKKNPDAMKDTHGQG